MSRPSLIQNQVSLRPHCSWKVGGEAEYYAQPSTIEELKQAVEWAEQQTLPLTVLSGGTNVLISDHGVEGLVVHMSRLSGLEVTHEAQPFQMTCWAGTPKAQVLREFLKRKLAPALFLSGLPGDVGGGVFMNAGVSEDVRPREFCEIVEWVEIMRFKNDSYAVERLPTQNIEWSYRHSQGWQPGVIVRAGLKWDEAPDEEVMKKARLATRQRLLKQPLQEPSGGSVFVNPPGHKSGKLIEDSGLKGFKIGGARVSEKHANFIVTSGDAKACDVDQVIKHVQKTVNEKFHVNLTTEIIYMGRWEQKLN